MKRTDLIRHLERHGCRLVRDRGKHSVYCNQQQDKFTAVPRHREIKKFVAKSICNDLGIPVPASN